MDFGGIAGDIGQAVQNFVPSFAPSSQPVPAPAPVEGPSLSPAPQPAAPAPPPPSPAAAPVPQQKLQPQPVFAPPSQTHPAPAPTTYTQPAEKVTQTEYRTFSSDSTTTKSSTSTTTTTTTTSSPTREPNGYLSTTTPTPEPTFPPTPNGLTHDGAVGLGVGITVLVVLLLAALAVKFFYFDRRKVFNGSGSNWVPTVFRRRKSVQEINPWPRPGGYTKQESFESIPSPTRPAEVRQLSALTTAVPSTAGTMEQKVAVGKNRTHIVDYYQPGR